MNTTLHPDVVRGGDRYRRCLNWWASGAPWRAGRGSAVQMRKRFYASALPSGIATTRYGLRAVLPQ